MATYLTVNDENLVTDIEVDPTHPDTTNTSMEVFVLKRELLRTLVDRGACSRAA